MKRIVASQGNLRAIRNPDILDILDRMAEAGSRCIGCCKKGVNEEAKREKGNERGRERNAHQKQTDAVSHGNIPESTK